MRSGAAEKRNHFELTPCWELGGWKNFVGCGFRDERRRLLECEEARPVRGRLAVLSKFGTAVCSEGKYGLPPHVWEIEDLLKLID